MTFALVDLEVFGTKPNRDHTGGFGSHMHAPGKVGRVISQLKERLIHLPMQNLGYAAAILRNAGLPTEHYSGATKGEDVIIIAASMHCYESEVAFAKEEKKRHPNSKIGFFGPFVKTHPQFFEQSGDFLIFGELENTLFAYLDGKCEWGGILDHGVVNDMDRLPTPDFRGLPVEEYSYFPLLHKRPFLSIQSSRGCSFDCDFCPYMVSQTKQYRRRSPEQVVEEMETQIQRHGIRSFLFRDLIFTVNRKHVEEICQWILSKGLDIEWACETRVDCLWPDLIDLMYQAGFRGINLGIETVNPETQKNSGKKPPELEQQEATIEYLHSKGIRINGFYMLGLVGDTPETMQKTIDYAEQLNTLGAQFCTMTPFPGTRLFDRMESDLLTRDFRKFDEYQPVVDIKTSTPQEVETYAKKAYRYYMRPKWFLRYGVDTAYRLFQNTL